MLPPKHIDVFTAALREQVTVFAAGSRWQNRCFELLPDFVERARLAFGDDLPHTHFYLFRTYPEFLEHWVDLTGHIKPGYSWQTGTGFFRNNRGVVIISEQNKRRRTQESMGIVMHEYGHALCWSVIGQNGAIPSWLNEGFADYLARPWYEGLFENAARTIRAQAVRGRIRNYASFARSVYGNGSAGYEIARLMVAELMRGKPLSTIAYILHKGKEKNFSYSDVIRQVCGFTPRQLFQKVLTDCGVTEPPAKPRQAARERVVKWRPWEERTELPMQLQQCVYDVYLWRCETFGRKWYLQDGGAYPHWDTLARSYLRFLQEKPYELMKKSDRQLIECMERLDPEARLLTRISAQELLPALCQSLPVASIEYLRRAIANVQDEDERKFVSKYMERYLQRFAPLMLREAPLTLASEYAKLVSYKFANGAKHPTDLAQYDRWEHLAKSVLDTLRSKGVGSLSQKLRQTLFWLVEYDEQGHLPAHCSGSELKMLLSMEMPDSLREYLSAGLMKESRQREILNSCDNR